MAFYQIQTKGRESRVPYPDMVKCLATISKSMTTVYGRLRVDKHSVGSDEGFGPRCSHICLQSFSKPDQASLLRCCLSYVVLHGACGVRMSSFATNTGH